MAAVAGVDDGCGAGAGAGAGAGLGRTYAVDLVPAPLPCGIPGGAADGVGLVAMLYAWAALGGGDWKAFASSVFAAAPGFSEGVCAVVLVQLVGMTVT